MHKLEIEVMNVHKEKDGIQVKQHAPKQTNWVVLLLLLFGFCFFIVQIGRHEGDQSGEYMLQSQFHQKVNKAGLEMLHLLSPALFIEETSREEQAGSLLSRISAIMNPLLSYKQEYRQPKNFVVAAQTVPVSYLENGGQEEDSGYQQEMATTQEVSHSEPLEVILDEEQVDVEQKVIEENNKVTKKHTYSKKYTNKQLNNFSFLKSQIYSVDAITPVTAKDLNAKKLLNKDLTITKDANQPKVLLYHTHASEAFADSRKGKQEDTVVGVGDVLEQELTSKYGITVLHDKTVYDVVNGKLDRSQAYNVAGDSIARTLRDNPSIEVVIDLHRDGVAEGTRLVTTVDGKPTAQIMLFNGMSRIKGKGEIAYLKNPNRAANLAFSLQLQLAAEDRYDGVMRKIFLRSYRYNLHYKERSLLVEAGAQTNTVQEVKNAMTVLAQALNDVLSKEGE